MKFIRALMIMLFVSGALWGADSSLEFRGVMVGGDATKLSLTDKATDTTRWVAIGQTFAGFTVKAYDVAKETATLVKDGKEVRIRLNSSQILDAPADAAAAPTTSVSAAKISLATARTIFNHLRQISAAADQYYLENGKNTATLEDLVGETNYIRQLKPEAGEDYGTLKIRSGKNEVFSVTTASGETVVYDAGGKGSSFYKVQPGDTLAQIAQKNGSSIQQLLELNETDTPNGLKIGQDLRIK